MHFLKKKLGIEPLTLMCSVVSEHVSGSCSPVDYNLPGSSVQRIFQARILNRVAISYSKGSLKSPALATRFFTTITILTLSSVQSRLTLCDPMNLSTPGLPVHHKLPEFTQTHAHRVGDAIQPSHPLSSPSPPAPNPSQHQGLFQRINSSHEVAKVLEFQLWHQSFQWTYLLQDGLVGSPCSPRDSQESSPTP